MKHCAILTMDCLDDFEAYDHLFDQPLLELGWQTHMVSWRQSNVDWNQYDVVLIRTPWDYQDDAPLFMQVLTDIEQSRAVLENSINIVEWNINKKYLRELEQYSVNIVPTIWEEQYNEALVGEYFARFDTQQIVIKPCVSANADNTFWLTTQNWQEYKQDLANAFASRDFMVQPFVESVINEGEYSCFYFDGQYSHSILKTPKENDFRVQEEHGGRLKLVDAEPVLREQAEHAMAKLAQIDEMPMYARVDFVRIGDKFAMMEAELIEPSLYFNMDENSAPLFATLFAERMARKHNL
ncbi:hypothetical protein E2K93_14815 [Thalassotalea sp. HSM 43]|uniref:ATP-grasp domain-containing protein n=1 Tax=Thalassotalea sp. HSM 43 TaxID=2552945 RepID=UPI001081E0DE|nr:hypothetical protein [Thalassotalea sp. HSM 43]QBY05566.1 hypothetical protein E2K93_14815 [Thalassotalea sp. HSM 43]